MNKKLCIKCKKELEILMFSKMSKSKDGLKCYCKDCCSYDNKIRYISKKNNCSRKEAEIINVSINNQKKSKYKICKKCNIEKKKTYFVKRKGKGDGYRNICLNCHRSEQQDRERKWRKANPDRRVSKSMAVRMWYSLKGYKNGNHWEDLVDYSLEDLKNHLEKQFQKGMTWDNYGKWHIDHIRPISSFSIKSFKDKEFQQCWKLDNLQPLWEADNKKKSYKW